MTSCQATELGDVLLTAMQTPTGLPASVINPKLGSSKQSFINPYNGNQCKFGDPTTLAEAGSVQMVRFHLL